MRGLNWLLGFLGGMVVLAFLVYAALVDKIETPWAVAGGTGALLVALWLYLDRETLGRWAAQKGSRYTTTAVMTTVLGGAVLAAVNVVAYRYDKRWDATSTGQFSLSDQTVSVLKGLDREVKVIAFFSLEGQAEKEKFKTLTEGYAEHSTLLKFEFHDPISEPVLAEQYKITTAYGTVVLESGDSKQRLESEFNEEALTNALIRLTSGKEHVLCFTEGHGELSPDNDGDPSSLSGVVIKLEGQNYKVKKTTLLRDGGVPADCEVTVVAAPQNDWLAPEREMLAAYVAGGGKALLMLDPTYADGLAADLSRYGVAVGKDVVLEQNPNYQLVGGDMSYLVLDPSSFDHHPITEPMKGMAILRLARSVGKGEEKAGFNVQELAHTSDYAWAETNLDQSQAPQPDPGQDRVGKIPLVAVAEVTDPEAITVGSRALGRPPAPGETTNLLDLLPGRAGATKEAPPAADAPPAAPAEPAAPLPEVTRAPGGKVVVFGDSDFASNALADQGNNLDLFQNAVAWLVGEEDQVSIRAPEGANGSLSMDLVQGILMGFTVLILAPGVAIGMAIGTWRKRRSV